MVGSVVVAWAAQAWAVTIDPSNFQICPDAVACSTNPKLYNNNTELNGITSTFDVTLVSQSPSISNPIVLIVGVPDTSTTTGDEATAPTLTSVFLNGGGSDLAPTSTSLGELGDLSSTSSPSVAYDQAGFFGANNSNSWTNWSGAYGTLIGGTAVDHFDLYVFSLNSSLNGGGLLRVTLGSTVPGSFVIAYGCSGSVTFLFNPAGNGGDNCVGSPNPYDDAFTEAGFIQSSSSSSSSSTTSSPGSSIPGGEATQPTVPEPASLLFLGSGLAYVASRVRRNRKR
jgi:hypothetical protein